MMHDATDIPAIVFGAFDRHNFGDLLFPHVCAALLRGKKLLFAGLAARDLRRHGGHRVEALAQLAMQWSERPVHILHAGGELLTCDAWEAAVMLMPSRQARQIIAHADDRPQERLEWARAKLGVSGRVPYTVTREMFPGAAGVIYNAVGGVDLDACDAAMRAEVLTKLKQADAVGVRDRRTEALVCAAGIAVRLMPDAAVMVAELFGAVIRQRCAEGEIARIRRTFPQGYVAVQFSAGFGDDETLSRIAAQLDRIVTSTGHGVVFFRAGAAPWHDDLRCYRRAAARMRAASVAICASLNLWDICALIAASRAYAGSSLHGRIVATAFALPRTSLRHPAQATWPSKQEAFAAAWEEAGMPTVVDVGEIAQAVGHALASDPEQRRHTAERLAARYREAFQTICAGLI